jgi:IS30 family transposase
MRHCTHLTTKEQEKILALKSKGMNNSAIGRAISRHRSTIGRELARVPGEYSPEEARKDREEKKSRGGRKRKLATDSQMRETVRRHLEEDWSPEQIAGRLELEGKRRISYGTIYRSLGRGDLPADLKKRLRLKGRAYRKGHKGRTGKLPAAHSIHERPAAANNRTEIGHWEGDTIAGKQGGSAIATYVDRKSLFVVASKLPGKRADPMKDATIAAFKDMAPGKVKSFTVDNGKEFAAFAQIEKELQVTVYFADPASPEQRPVSENTNGLLRQYFPKGSSFKGVTRKQVADAVNRLNLRPRKSLKWKTSFEVFHSQVLQLI